MAIRLIFCSTPPQRGRTIRVPYGEWVAIALFRRTVEQSKEATGVLLENAVEDPVGFHVGFHGGRDILF